MEIGKQSSAVNQVDNIEASPTSLVSSSSAGNSPEVGVSLADRILGGFDPVWFDLQMARYYLRKAVDQGPVVCPHCQAHVGRDQYDGVQRFTRLTSGKTLRCLNCRRYFSVFTGTPFAGAKIDPRAIYCLILFHALGLPVSRIAALCQVSTETVRHWSRRLELD